MTLNLSAPLVGIMNNGEGTVMHRTRSKLTVACPKGGWDGSQGDIRREVCDRSDGRLRVRIQPVLSYYCKEVLNIVGCWVKEFDKHYFLVEEKGVTWGGGEKVIREALFVRIVQRREGLIIRIAC